MTRGLLCTYNGGLRTIIQLLYVLHNGISYFLYCLTSTQTLFPTNALNSALYQQMHCQNQVLYLSALSKFFNFFLISSSLASFWRSMQSFLQFGWKPKNQHPPTTEVPPLWWHRKSKSTFVRILLRSKLYKHQCQQRRGQQYCWWPFLTFALWHPAWVLEKSLTTCDGAGTGRFWSVWLLKLKE